MIRRSLKLIKTDQQRLDERPDQQTGARAAQRKVDKVFGDGFAQQRVKLVAAGCARFFYWRAPSPAGRSAPPIFTEQWSRSRG